ncbi:LacI family transcriptional regulator [Treponema sp. TIM-1]|uniref:LacI family DNA-binding transcriptional regulator n=1 Tax=Treponema sp. TIM-1 TaxID=2898417 RepID=UPI00397F3E40
MVRKKGQVTLKDIAQALDLSINTVSCALKNRNSISPETVRRVKEKAEEFGYIPNSVASSIRTGYTRTIAIILGDIANAYFAIMVRELERITSKENYVAMILVTDEDPQLETKAIQAALSKNVDGIILFPTCRTEAGINLIRKVGTPFILIGRRLPDSNMDYIVSDDVNGGYLATRYLLDRGHKRILLFAGPDCVSSAFERKLGYLKAMEAAGIATEDLIIPCDITVNETMNRLIKKTLQCRKDFDAIFTYNDIIAFRIIRIACQMKIALPDIVGYDNIQSKLDFGFNLVSVNIYKSLMAEKAATCLFSRIHNPKEIDGYFNEVVPVDLNLTPEKI